MVGWEYRLDELETGVPTLFRTDGLYGGVSVNGTGNDNKDGEAEVKAGNDANDGLSSCEYISIPNPIEGPATGKRLGLLSEYV